MPKSAKRQDALLCGEGGMFTKRSQPTLLPKSLEDELSLKDGMSLRDKMNLRDKMSLKDQINSKDKMRMKLAIESLERENKRLKELVVRLSETVLRDISRR